MKDKVDFNKLVGSRIARFRKEKNLTQYELAEHMNYSDKSISKWEQGQSIPNIFVLNELAQFFGVSLDVLIGNKNYKSVSARKDTRFKHAFLYSLLVFSVFFIAFGVVFIVVDDFEKFKTWSLILWGVAGATIPIFIYSLIYKKEVYSYISSTIFVWMITVGLYLTFEPRERLWVLFVIAVPINLFLEILLVYIYYVFGKDKQIT